MTTLDDAAQMGAKEQGLAVISTLRADGTIQSSVVNAGVMQHPLVDRQVLAFVSYGKVKLANLRTRPQLTATFRSGWQWAAVEATPNSSDSMTLTPRSTMSGYDFCCVRRS